MSKLIATDVNSKTGRKLLIEKLDRVFESDKTDEACLFYSRFINYHKSDEISMTDYIIEFEYF